MSPTAHPTRADLLQALGTPARRDRGSGEMDGGIDALEAPARKQRGVELSPGEIDAYLSIPRGTAHDGVDLVAPGAKRPGERPRR